MPPGRPKKLAEVKVLEGTYRKDREVANVAEPDRLAHIPDPPDGLTERAGYAWTLICTWLHGIGQLATTDIETMAMLCNELDLYWQYDRKVKQKGAVIEFQDADGNLLRVVPNPYTALRNAALSNYLRLIAVFSLPPALRQRIQTMKSAKPQSKLQQLRDKRG